MGHIKRNCPKTRSNNTVQFNNRQINLCDTDYEYKSAEEEEDVKEFDEFETYLTTRARSTPYPPAPKSKNRRNIQSESKREETLRSPTSDSFFTQTFTSPMNVDNSS